MIKGINKQILEVTNPESPYFERIIFFVKSDSQGIGESVLKKEAEKISLKAKKPPKTRKSLKQRLFSFGYIALGIGAGCALSFIMSTIV